MKTHKQGFEAPSALGGTEYTFGHSMVLTILEFIGLNALRSVGASPEEIEKEFQLVAVIRESRINDGWASGFVTGKTYCIYTEMEAGPLSIFVEQKVMQEGRLVVSARMIYFIENQDGGTARVPAELANKFKA